MSENKPTSPHELAESFMANLTKTDEDEQRAFIDEIADALATPTKQIPEPVFRELFLPYLTGKKSPVASGAEGEIARDPVAHWSGLVGSASEPADIIDTQGNVLFQVPPMYDTSIINTRDRGSAHSFATIFRNYQEESRVHPAYGTRYLAEQLSQKVSAELKQTPVEKNGWRPVLEYYKLIEKEETPEATKSEISDDDLELGD